MKVVPNFIRDNLNEIEILQMTLNHENIVKYLSYYTLNGHLCIVLEYCQVE